MMTERCLPSRTPLVMGNHYDFTEDGFKAAVNKCDPLVLLPVADWYRPRHVVRHINTM